MPRNLVYERWTIDAVLKDVGEDVADYAVYYKGDRVLQIIPAGRFNNLVRLVFGRNDSTVVSATAILDVGV